MNEEEISLERSERSKLIARGRGLEYITIAWNTLEGLLAVIAGILAGSVALIGFGFDSLIEVTSAGTLMWRLHADIDETQRERVERIALRIVGVCFMLLASYVIYESGRSLWYREPPERSLFGIAVAIAALIVMPLLTRAKRKVGRSIVDTHDRASIVQVSALLLPVVSFVLKLEVAELLIDRDIAGIIISHA